MRLGVYTDYHYWRDGRLVLRRARVLHVHHQPAAVDGPHRAVRAREPEAGPLPLPRSGRRSTSCRCPTTRASRTRSRRCAAMAGSLRRFWRSLDDVDAVWLLGPHLLAIGFALLAALRRKKVFLGVRQDLPRYVESRHPGKRWMTWAANLLEGAFRLMARRVPGRGRGPAAGRELPRRAAPAGGVRVARRRGPDRRPGRGAPQSRGRTASCGSSPSAGSRPRRTRCCSPTCWRGCASAIRASGC